MTAALLCANSHHPSSVDATRFGMAPSLANVLGAVDPQFEAVDRHNALQIALTAMPERERRIIGLRFFADMTQAQIAVDIGVSQMHVSRLLAGALAHLRDGLSDDEYPGESLAANAAAVRLAAHGANLEWAGSAVTMESPAQCARSI